MKLKKYNKNNYNPGGKLKRILWYLTSGIFINTSIPWPYPLKRFILRIFGAKIRENVIIKQNVKIKYPWFLEIGNNSWVGEKVWVDNLDKIKIGNNVCISQGTYLCTGSHNYKKESFDLITKPITIEDGAWIAAKSTIAPGVKIRKRTIISIGSVLTKNTKENKIYKGNPAKEIKDRKTKNK